MSTPANSEPTRRTSPARRRITIGVIILVLVAVAAVLVARSIGGLMGMMSGPAPATVAQIAAAQPGASISVALQMTQTTGNSLVGNVLNREPGGDYAATNRSLTGRWSARTPITMGKQDDVHPGAILQVDGHVGADGSTLDTDRIVILTGVVTVR